MNKKLAAALSGGTVLILALSGCKGDTDKLNAWATAVCDGIQPQKEKIGSASQAIQEAADASKPSDVKKADSQAFQDMSEAYRAMGTAIDKAGPPAIDDGETRQQEAVKTLNDTADSYTELKKKIDALDTKDQAKFAAGLRDIATRPNELVKSGNDALRKLEAGDTGEAMARQKSCKSPSAQPSP